MTFVEAECGSGPGTALDVLRALEETFFIEAKEGGWSKDELTGADPPRAVFSKGRREFELGGQDGAATNTGSKGGANVFLVFTLGKFTARICQAHQGMRGSAAATVPSGSAEYQCAAKRQRRQKKKTKKSKKENEQEEKEKEEEAAGASSEEGGEPVRPERAEPETDYVVDKTSLVVQFTSETAYYHNTLKEVRRRVTAAGKGWKNKCITIAMCRFAGFGNGLDQMFPRIPVQGGEAQPGIAPKPFLRHREGHCVCDAEGG